MHLRHECDCGIPGQKANPKIARITRQEQIQEPLLHNAITITRDGQFLKQHKYFFLELGLPNTHCTGITTRSWQMPKFSFMVIRSYSWLFVAICGYQSLPVL